MTSSIMAPAKFRDNVDRSIRDIGHSLWYMNQIEAAAKGGDERCKEFLSEHGEAVRVLHTCSDSWRNEVTRITDLVEGRSAKSEGKVFCEICSKNVKNLSDHQRRSSSHIGRARVIELDNDPNWERLNYDTRSVVDLMLRMPPPTGTGDDSNPYQWDADQKGRHSQSLMDRSRSLSDVIITQNYNYFKSGKENKWGSRDGNDGGKYWVRPHINEYAHHLVTIAERIRDNHNLQRYQSDNRILLIEFHKMVDPIIRNPNDIARHAAMYALQLDSKGD
jgi:hypothetical protein